MNGECDERSYREGYSDGKVAGSLQSAICAPVQTGLPWGGMFIGASLSLLMTLTGTVLADTVGSLPHVLGVKQPPQLPPQLPKQPSVGAAVAAVNYGGVQCVTLEYAPRQAVKPVVVQPHKPKNHTRKRRVCKCSTTRRHKA